MARYTPLRLDGPHRTLTTPARRAPRTDALFPKDVIWRLTRSSFR